MRRLARQTFVATVLLLPVGAVAGWVVSGGYRFGADYTWGHGRAVQCWAEGGRLVVIRWHHDGEHVGPRGFDVYGSAIDPGSGDFSPDRMAAQGPRPLFRVPGLRYVHDAFPPQTITNLDGTSYTFRRGGAGVLLVPAWLIVSLSLLPAALLSWRWRCRAVRQREGRCVHCGYDLRASPGRCPECGVPRAGAAGSR